MAIDETVKRELESKYDGMDLADVIKALFKNKAERDKVESKLEGIKGEQGVIEQVIISKMERAQLTETAVAGAGKIFVKPKSFFSIKTENQPLVFGAFKKSKNFKELVKETVNYQSLQSAMSEYYEKNNKVPDGIDMFVKTVVNTRKK